MEIRHLYNSLLLAESHLYQFERRNGVPELLTTQVRSRIQRLRSEIERHPDRLCSEQERAYLARQAVQHFKRTATNRGACNTCEHYHWNALVRGADTDEALDVVAEKWLNLPGETVVCDKTGLKRDQPLKDLCLEYFPDKKGLIGNAHHGVIIENGLANEAEAWRALYQKYRA